MVKCITMDQVKELIEPITKRVEELGQLGRFDFASILLAILAIFLALFAFYSFGYLSGKSERIATITAKKTAEEQLKPHIDELRTIVKTLGLHSREPSEPTIEDERRMDENNEFGKE